VPWECEDCGAEFLDRDDDVAADRLALVFQLWLERHYPEKRWVRARRCRKCSAARKAENRG